VKLKLKLKLDEHTE